MRKKLNIDLHNRRGAEKKWLCIILLLLYCLSHLLAAPCGDVNSDNTVNIIDALMTAQYSIGLSPSPFAQAAADVNCDKTVNIIDALMIARFYVAIINSFEPCNPPSPTPGSLPTAPPVQPGEAAPLGFCGNVTGGAGGEVFRVTTTSEFDQACNLEVPAIIEVAGEIDTHFPSVRSNKTIIGVAPGACLSTGITIIDSASNVIVRNLTISNPSSDDGISVFGKNVWIDHCTFVDCSDGSIDITNEADFVTVSWCKFYYTERQSHNFPNLISSSESDSGEFRVTFHHNWWSANCIERMPSVRWGNVHVFNNYLNSPGNNYCVRTRIEAEVLVENNYFENVQNPWERYLTSGTPGKLLESGNVLIGCTWVTSERREIPSGRDTVFTPPYAYELESAETAKARIMSYAGSPW